MELDDGHKKRADSGMGKGSVAVKFRKGGGWWEVNLWNAGPKACGEGREKAVCRLLAWRVRERM